MPPCRRIKVTNIAATSTEESLRDFFSFCGDIKLVHLYTSATDGPQQEAVVLFETEAGASTAVLLDNAVVDGARIRVEAFPETPAASPTGERAKSPRSGSVFNDVLSETKSVASNISKSAKSLDEQYEISGKVTAAATTVVTATTTAALVVDEKLHVRENATYVYESARKSAIGLDEKYKISETVNVWMGSMFGWKSATDLPAEGAPVSPNSRASQSPRTPERSSTAPAKSRTPSPQN